jgi:hypothetical protein
VCKIKGAVGIGGDDACELPVGTPTRQVDLAGDALALGRRVGGMAEQQRVALLAWLEGPPEAIVGRPADGGAQLAAAPGQPHAACGHAFQCALQALEGAIDPLGFADNLQHARSYRARGPCRCGQVRS